MASIFATHRENAVFSDKDYAIFQLLDFGMPKTADKPSFAVQFRKKPLNWNSSLYANKLINCTLKSFQCRCSILTNQTNDRMKVQKGVFLCFERGFIIDGHLLLYDRNGVVIKYVFPHNSVKHVHNYVVKNNPEYEYECLMDPYLFVKKGIYK